MKKLDLVKIIKKSLKEAKLSELKVQATMKQHKGKVQCICYFDNGMNIVIGPVANQTQCTQACALKKAELGGKRTPDTRDLRYDDEMMDMDMNMDMDKGISMRENNKLTNNKMDLKEHKETLARFKKLAGIIKEEEEDKKDEGHGYSMEELKSMMEETDNEGKMMNESLFAAIGGLVGVLGAAGVISSIEMALEDPAISEKYPKLAKVFEFLAKVGGAVGKGIK